MSKWAKYRNRGRISSINLEILKLKDNNMQNERWTWSELDTEDGGISTLRDEPAPIPLLTYT